MGDKNQLFYVDRIKGFRPVLLNEIQIKYIYILKEWNKSAVIENIEKIEAAIKTDRAIASHHLQTCLIVKSSQNSYTQLRKQSLRGT